jgi:hypothetical protein
VKRLIPGAAAACALLATSAAAAETHRFALSMLHFNVQYVAGGLFGFFPVADPVIDLDAEQVEDAIIRESFEPVLDLLAAHPTWGANLEMQGYMLDVMAARHGEVLDKLRALAKAGQAEVNSFHYSDQLFLAFPREDWERSRMLNDATFARHDIPRGDTVFCQEGQAGPGLAGAMASAGYRTLLYPKNLYGYQHGDEAPIAPLYRFGDVQMLFSRGGAWQQGEDSIEVGFWFVDDGELLATGDFDPYIAEHFKKNPAAIAEREAELVALEASGVRIATITEYVDTISAIVPLADPPPLLEGTWQPSSTDGIHRWLGGYGLWWKDERDNDVRTLGAMAHRELVAAETAATAASLDAREELDGAWRLLALGQVSDASGINPFRGEVEYGIAHLTEALRIGREVIVRAKETLGPTVDIDSAAGTAVPSGAAAPPEGELVEPMLELVIESGARASTETWRRAGEGLYRVELRFTAGDDRSIAVTFPGEPGDIVYTPGLADAPVHAPREAFVFEHFEMALSDGLLGLAPERFVIKDQANVHVAASIRLDSGDARFHDDTVPEGEEVTWVFYLVLASEERAAAVARSVNVTPMVRR